jgi:hypothetical protein
MMTFIFACRWKPLGTKSISRLSIRRTKLAGGLGFEPRLAESESAVLPLDDPPTIDAWLIAAGRTMRKRGVDALV